MVEGLQNQSFRLPLIVTYNISLPLLVGFFIYLYRTISVSI